MNGTFNGACFGIDCIRSYNDIRKLIQTSVKTCDQFLAILKARVSAEEVHYKNLARIATMEFTYCESTLQASMDQLLADTNHKATQHKLLAENIMQDIYNPIATLRNQLQSKEKSISNQYNSMLSELRQLEDSLKRYSLQYERSYKEAYAACAALREQGIAEPVLTPDMFIEEIDTSDSPRTSNQITGTPAASKSLAATSAFLANTLSPSLSVLAAKNRAALSWFQGAAGSPMKDGQSEAHALKLMQTAEQNRRHARHAWFELVVAGQRHALRMQVALTKLQGAQESFLSLMQTQLRRFIVFESSCLANQQYDLQMLSQVMEQINPSEDLLNWMARHRTAFDLDVHPSCSDILPNVTHIDDLPRPPTSSMLATPLLALCPPLLPRTETQKFTTVPVLRGAPLKDGKVEYGTAEDALRQLVHISNEWKVTWAEMYAQEEGGEPADRCETARSTEETTEEPVVEKEENSDHGSSGDNSRGSGSGTTNEEELEYEEEEDEKGAALDLFPLCRKNSNEDAASPTSASVDFLSPRTDEYVEEDCPTVWDMAALDSPLKPMNELTSDM